jgi:hypothetical protein
MPPKETKQKESYEAPTVLDIQPVTVRGGTETGNSKDVDDET